MYLKTRIQRKFRKINKHRMVLLDSIRVKKKIRNNNKQCLFIDCGTNLGQGFNHFSKYYSLDDFDFIMIEQNENCISFLENKYKDLIENNKIRLIPKAAFTNSDGANLFGLQEYSEVRDFQNPTTVNGNLTSQGASILKNHNSKYYGSKVKNSMSVETFSFSKLLKSESKNYNLIIVKMDIEGGEYEVLENLISKRQLNLMHTLYLEFHSHFMDEKNRNIYKEKEKKIIEKIKNSSLHFRQWN